MATKKVIRKKSHSAPKKRAHHVAKKSHKRKKSSSGRKRGMLSEMFSPGAAQGALRCVASGAVGGALAGIVEKAMPNQSETNQSLAMLGLGFLAAGVAKTPNVAAGLAGVAGYKIGKTAYQGLQDGMALAENRPYTDNIERLPMFLNEDGTQMNLADAQMLADAALNPFQPAYATNWGGI